MKQGIQTLLSEAGESACYALDIIEIGERISGKGTDLIDTLYQAFTKGYVYYNEKDPNDNDNFFVKNPAGLLSLVTGGRWDAAKVNADYTPKPGEYVVDYWERQAAGKTIGHFRLPDWDSLADSQTVKYGRIASKRVFRKIA